MPVDFWLTVLSRFPAAPYNPNVSVEKRISHYLMRGRIKLYPVSHLDQRHGQTNNPYPVVTGKQGLSYQLAPASLLLVNATSKTKSFANKDQATAFVKSLNLDEAQLLQLAQSTTPPIPSTQRDALMAGLSQALVDGRLVVFVHEQSVTPPATTNGGASSSVVAASKPVSLGPHVEGEISRKLDEEDEEAADNSANSKQTTPETQKTVDNAVISIKESSFAATDEGKKVTSKIDDLNASGKIKFESMGSSTRGKWSGSEIVVNENFDTDIDATASEIVHEATHALHEDEFPLSKTKITIDEEMRTNENQLALYEDQRKGGFRDPELEQRRNDHAKGMLRDNVRTRYPGTPEHL